MSVLPEGFPNPVGFVVLRPGKVMHYATKVDRRGGWALTSCGGHTQQMCIHCHAWIIGDRRTNGRWSRSLG